MTRVKESSDSLRPHLALIAVQILFGSWPVLGKVVLRSISPSSLVALRLTGAALAFALLQRKITPLLKMPVRDICYWRCAACWALSAISFYTLKDSR